MHKSSKIFGLASTAAFALVSSLLATTYNGNQATGFGGPFGQGVLNLTTSGGTVSGTITAGGGGQLYDEAVIYIDSQAGGFANTSTFTAATTNGNVDYLQQAAAGTNGTLRATVNFATGFGADYVIALSPTQASYGALYAITAAGALNYLQSVDLAPTGNNAGPYTFDFSLANIGSPTSFSFSTTYLNAHSDIYRSNETIGNTIADVTNASNTGNLGQDTASVGFVTFAVPEPGTWAMMIGGAMMLLCFGRRSIRGRAR